MVVRFSQYSHIVNGVKTLVEVNRGGGWGESNNDSDDE